MRYNTHIPVTGNEERRSHVVADIDRRRKFCNFIQCSGAPRQTDMIARFQYSSYLHVEIDVFQRSSSSVSLTRVQFMSNGACQLYSLIVSLMSLIERLRGCYFDRCEYWRVRPAIQWRPVGNGNTDEMKRASQAVVESEEIRFWSPIFWPLIRLVEQCEWQIELHVIRANLLTVESVVAPS